MDTPSRAPAAASTASNEAAISADAASSANAASTPPPAVRLHRFADRGTGLVTTRAVCRGEVLFVDRPQAWFQPRPNAALAPCCAHAGCMRTLGSVEQLVDAAQAVWTQASAAAAAAVAAGAHPQPVVMQGSPEDRARKIAALQRILTASSPQPDFVQCRSCSAVCESDCEAQYCSPQCEEAAWRGGHCVLCVGSNPALESFFASRNVRSNADLHVAAQMIAGFIAALIKLPSQQHKYSEQAAAASSSASAHDEAAALWSAHTQFHALPWSLVLAVQAVQQSGAVSVPLRVVAAVNASIAARDAADAKAEGLVATIGEASIAADAPAAAASPASAVDPSDRALFDALAAAQLQYRAALAEPFALLRSALLSTSHSPASRSAPLWSRFVSLPAFDLLAGANRLNCTLTQCAMSLPDLAAMAQMQPPQKPRRLEEADLEAADSDEEQGGAATSATASAATAASAAMSSSSAAPVPFLVRSLESLFLPLGLPLSCARGLFALHSKMNHACGQAANARVENWRETQDIRWSAASVARATQRAAAAAQQQSSGASNSGGGGGLSAAKKKAQAKARKAAATRLARAEQEAREEIQQLEEMALRVETQATATAAPAASSSSSAAATSSSASAASASAPSAPLASAAAVSPSALHSSQIIVRALRDLEAGEEVLIDYLPTTAAASAAVAQGPQQRRDYLRTHYLFECHCSRCNAAAAK